VSANVWQGIFLAVVAGLLIAAAVRWRRTPQTHPEHQARGDVASLLLVVLVGQAGALARSHFAFRSPGFWVCTLLLLPVAFAALWLLRRLFRAYRRSSTNAP
jgi:hypothetical protein